MKNVNDMLSLNGKTAIVTGGHGNYGKQIVLALAQAGAKVYTASRNYDANDSFAKELQAKGLSVHPESFDQSDEKSIIDFKDRILSKEGKIDVLVNNSVLRIVNGFNDTKEHFDDSFKTNGTGIIILCREFGDHMAKNRNGSIINIGSYMGILGADDNLYEGLSFSGFSAPDYFFHKGGLTNFTKFLASYYGPHNVRCNILSLGGLFNNQDEVFVNRYCKRTFLKRMANESDIMGICVLLASDASSYITGATIPIDGGYSAK